MGQKVVKKGSKKGGQKPVKTAKKCLARARARRSQLKSLGISFGIEDSLLERKNVSPIRVHFFRFFSKNGPFLDRF